MKFNRRIATILSIPLIFNTGLEVYSMQNTPLEIVEMDFKNIPNLRMIKPSTYLTNIELESEKVVESNVREVEGEIIEEVIEEPIEEYNNIQEWTFEVSYYCSCWNCTQNGDGQTASGEYAVEGVTIALPTDIPFGTKAYIEGVGEFINQDTGGFIQYTDEGYMRVDVYLEDHYECYERGRHYANGYLEFQ